MPATSFDGAVAGESSAKAEKLKLVKIRRDERKLLKPRPVFAMGQCINIGECIYQVLSHDCAHSVPSITILGTAIFMLNESWW